MGSEQSSHSEQTALTDVQLWQALSHGQTSALGILYDRHAGLVYGIALKVLSNPQEAEDLTQDIFVKLMNGSYDPRRGSFRTFLAILTRSRAIDRVRSHQRQSKQTLQYWRTDVSASEPAPIEESVLQEQGEDMHAALAQLSEEQQQLLKLSYYDGLTHTTIAERLGLPLGTVKSKMRRGLLKLREILQDQLD